MSLPAKFTNANYYLITGQYCFGGDLVVTKGRLYYFPSVDLEAERNKHSTAAHMIAGVAGVIISNIIHRLAGKMSKGILVEKNLWREGISDEQFRQGAESYIKAVKETWQPKSFSNSLPAPTCVEAEEVADLRLSGFGKLSFNAQSDRHDFKVGWLKRKALQAALWEGGFGKV